MDTIPDSVKYIRYETVVYVRVEGDTPKFRVDVDWPSINKAKKFTRDQPLGTVMRKETLDKMFGKKYFYNLIQ